MQHASRSRKAGGSFCPARGGGGPIRSVRHNPHSPQRALRKNQLRRRPQTRNPPETRPSERDRPVRPPRSTTRAIRTGCLRSCNATAGDEARSNQQGHRQQISAAIGEVRLTHCSHVKTDHRNQWPDRMRCHLGTVTGGLRATWGSSPMASRHRTRAATPAEEFALFREPWVAFPAGDE